MISDVDFITTISVASAAMFKLNIIRKALHLCQGLSLTEDPRDSYIYYPLNPFAFNSSSYYKTLVKWRSLVKSRVKERYIMFSVVLLLMVVSVLLMV